MASALQHRILHGVVLRDFLVAMGIEPTKENILVVKEMFKDYLRVHKSSRLSDKNYAKMVSAISMLAAREWGVELPARDAEKTMIEVLRQTTKQYEQDNR